MLQWFILDSIRKGQPLYILSGKAAGSDVYSLLRITRAACAQYGRPLTVISVDPSVKDRQPYNPLVYMSEEQIADLLCSLSEFTEPHYRVHFSTWIKQILEVVKRASIPFSLEVINDFYQWDDYVGLVEDLKERELIEDDEYEEYMNYEEIAKVSKNTQARFLDAMQGSNGRFLFRQNTIAVNAVDARSEGAVFFVDLDAFKYRDFTEVLGKFAIADFNNCIARERCASTDPEHHKRIILDEMAAYLKKGDASTTWAMFAQARSFGYQICAATQTRADLAAIDEEFAKQILGDTGMKIIFRLDNSDEAEEFASNIGTYKTIETTYKTAGRWIDGAGTKKYIDRFFLSPNDIKRLPKQTAVCINKEAKILCKIKLGFPPV